MDFLLPSVVHAEYRGEFKMRVAFSDGVEGTIDFSGWLTGPVFEPLKDRSYFVRFFIDGGTVAWPNGADIAPETLYERAKASGAAEFVPHGARFSEPVPHEPRNPSRTSRGDASVVTGVRPASMRASSRFSPATNASNPGASRREARTSTAA